MRVLVACECSGIVRDAFARRGHEAVSCDLNPSETPVGAIYAGRTAHYQGDVRDILGMRFDLMIAHPPCDYLAVSGNRWFSDEAKAGEGILTGGARRKAMMEAFDFVKLLWNAPIPRIAIENPIGRLSSLWMKPKGRNGQIIQPWAFWDGEPGKGEVKATCLWLKNLYKLVPTTPNETGRHPACWLQPPGEARKANRSRSYPGIARAMAEQWGDCGWATQG